MDHLSATKRLFHAIVVIGMATTLGCSSDSTSITDASTDATADATGMDSASDKDSTADAKADAGSGDSSDGFGGWLANC
jgi:hypothetical protein